MSEVLLYTLNQAGWEAEVDGAGPAVQRFRGGLVFKAHRLSVSLNSRLESNKEESRRPADVRRGEPSVA